MLLENMLDRIDVLEAKVNISKNLQFFNRSLVISNGDAGNKRNQKSLKAEGEYTAKNYTRQWEYRNYRITLKRHRQIIL